MVVVPVLASDGMYSPLTMPVNSVAPPVITFPCGVELVVGEGGAGGTTGGWTMVVGVGVGAGIGVLTGVGAGVGVGEGEGVGVTTGVGVATGVGDALGGAIGAVSVNAKPIDASTGIEPLNI